MFDRVTPFFPIQRKESPSPSQKQSQRDGMRPNNAWREDMFSMSRNDKAGGDAPVQMKSPEEEKPAQMKSAEEEKPAQMKSPEEEKPAQMKSPEEEKPAQKKEEEEKPAQMKSPEEEKPAQMKSAEEEKPAQMKSAEEEKPAQMKSAEEEKPVQMKEEEEKPAQMKTQAGPLQNHAASKGHRTRMPTHVQRKMENSLGADFSTTRIHADSDKASRMNALAYTQGEDIYFARGKYDPESKRGQELLGHELHHVVQQREGRVQSNSKQHGIGINNDHALEHEADMKGKAAAEG